MAEQTEIQLNVSDLGGNTETITVPQDITVKNLQLHIEKNTSFGRSNLMNNDGPLDDLSASLESLGITQENNNICCISNPFQTPLDFNILITGKKNADGTVTKVEKSYHQENLELKLFNALNTALCNNVTIQDALLVYKSTTIQDHYTESDLEGLEWRLIKQGGTLSHCNKCIDLEDSYDCNSTGTDWDSFANIDFVRLEFADGSGYYVVIVNFSFGSPYGSSDQNNVILISFEEQTDPDLQVFVNDFVNDLRQGETIHVMPDVPNGPIFEAANAIEIVDHDSADHSEDDWDEFKLLFEQIKRDWYIFGSDFANKQIEIMRNNGQLSWSLDTNFDWLTQQNKDSLYCHVPPSSDNDSSGDNN